MNYNIIYKGDKAYQILRDFPASSFQNKDNSTNPQLLGAWVSYLGGNHVLQANNKILICKEIEEATIL
jgi:hypothetical protein